jgi:hypothetical protein
MKQEHISNIIDKADVFFAELFSPGEAPAYSIRLEGALHRLTDEQVAAINDHVEEYGMNSSVGHDVFGIINKDRCFVPRIRALAEVTPFIA